MNQIELKNLVAYDPFSGLFTWRERSGTSAAVARWNGRWAGQTAGSIQTKGNGYRRVRLCLNGTFYFAHRLAWLYMMGEFPVCDIDHRNRDATDNIWGNLRLSAADNQRNKSLQRNNCSGVSGVSWCSTVKKWCARAWSKSGAYKVLGYFGSVDDAANALEKFRAANNYSVGHGQPAPYPVAAR